MNTPGAALPRVFWYLLAGVFLSRAGGFVFPFLAIYLKEGRHLNIEDAGTVLGIVAAGGVIAGPVGGILADRLGRKWTMVLSLFSAALATWCLSFAEQLSAIAALGFATALASGLSRPAMGAAIADLIAPADRPRAYGLLFWAANIGFAIAPLLGGLAIKHSFQILFAVDAAALAVMGLLILLRVPETKPALSERSATYAGDALAPYADGLFLAFGTALLLTKGAYAQALSTLPMDLTERGIAAERYGWLITLNAAMITVLQPFAGRVLSKLKAGHALAIGSALIGIGFALPLLAPVYPLYVASAVVWTLGEIALAPTAPALAAMLAPASARGSYQGALEMFLGGAYVLGPIAGTRVLSRAGADVLWLGCLSAGVAAALLYAAITRALSARSK